MKLFVIFIILCSQTIICQEINNNTETYNFIDKYFGFMFTTNNDTAVVDAVSPDAMTPDITLPSVKDENPAQSEQKGQYNTIVSMLGKQQYSYGNIYVIFFSMIITSVYITVVCICVRASRRGSLNRRSMCRP